MKEEQQKDDLGKFNLFKNIVVLTKKYGKKNVMFSLLIFIIFATMAFLAFLIKDIDVNKVLDKYNNNQEKTHQESLLKREIANNTINPMLTALLLQAKADRVMLFEFHNGGQNNVGLSFAHFSATYEKIDLDNDSIDAIKDQYKQQDTGSYTDVIEELRREHYIFSSDINLDKNSLLIRKMRRNEVKSYWIYGIFNPNGTPKFILSITSNHVNGLDESKINRITPEILNRIGSLLDGVNSQNL